MRAVVLDFDGVIVESNGIKTEAFREVFRRFPEHGARMMTFHEEHISLSRVQKFRYLVEELLGRPGDETLVEELARDFSWRVLEEVVRCPLVPGAMEFLGDLAPRLPVYLASITPEPELEEILERRGLRQYFRAVFGYPPRAKAEAVEIALSVAGGDRDAVVLVGDSPGDLRVAREFGIQFVGRDSGIPFDEPELLLYPDLWAVGKALRPRICA
jgi:phosphoglycolate phosphatase-like HAD superfamily hydrolase